MIKVKYWIWLTLIFGIGNKRIWDLIKISDDPVIAYKELCRGDHDVVLKEIEIEKIRTVSLEKCEKIIEFCNSKGYKIAGFSSYEYPQYLRHIYNPPAVLYYQGDLNILNEKISLTVVGTRNASTQSLMVASNLCRELSNVGFVITSGFAVGVDITAHLSATNLGNTTVCVLGCGIDVDYPKDNSIHRSNILKNKGIFITEYLPGTKPAPQNFPKRNRILSGLSRAVVIIEAGERSGSLITAELGLEQGREIFCIPPLTLFDGRYSGNIKFLRDGAYPVYGSEDIINHFDMFIENEFISKDSSISFEFEQNIEDTIADKTADKIEEVSIIEKIEKINIDSYSEIQQAIIRFLLGEKSNVDTISDNLGIDTDEILIELTDLEIDGIVEAFPGKFYGLK